MKSYKDLIVKLQESEPKQGSVKTHKYSWGTMKTVHHGANFSIPLHPEHHQAISKLKDEQEHKFKDETGRHWVARRKGENVHFDTTGNGSMKTHVPMHTMHEEYEGEALHEEDHAELARKSAAEYRKALARGDSVAANAANAEHIRHKRAAQVMRKKSHTPGEMDEAYESPLDTPAQKKAREDLKKTLLDIKKKDPKHPAVQDVKESEDHHELGIDHDEPISRREHIMNTIKKHGGKITGQSDKSTYVHFSADKVHAAKAEFKSGRVHTDNWVNGELKEETITEAVKDLDKYFSSVEMKGDAPKKTATKKEPEPAVKGSQLKFFNTFKEELDINEKMNLAKADMGDVIKDFQKSDAPQFAGKSKEKKREMAIAAKLEAERQQNEGVIQPTGDDSIDTGADNKGKTTYVTDKKGKLVSFKHEGAWKKAVGTVTDKSGAKHTPMSRARDLARSAMKTVKEEVAELDEDLSKWSTDKLQKHWDSHKDQERPSPVFANQLKRVAAELKKRKTVKEDLDEAFINGREYASHGLIHPDHAKMNLYQKNNNTIDFYHSKTGDKVPGKVVKNDGKEVHIRATNGDVHQYKVTSHLPTQQNEGVNKSDVPAYLRKNDKLTTKDLEKERTQNRSHPETIKKINGTVQEEAPVAPVPGQKWKDHAVVTNGKQRLVIHRKNLGNYSKDDGWKEVAPGQKVKEDVDFDGNFVSEPLSYQEFAMMIEGKAQYIVKATHNKTGRVKVTNYVADKDESAHGVQSRAEREHKPMGYSIDSIRRKDIEAHDEGEEGSIDSTQKKGRGRPAGSKSGARGPRIK